MRGVVGAALHGGVVGDDDALAPADTPDAGDDAGGGHVVVVDAVGGEGAELKEGAVGVDEALDALSGEELAAAVVTFDVAFATGPLDTPEAVAKVVDKGEVRVAVLPVARIEHIDAGGEQGEVVEGHGRKGTRGGGDRTVRVTIVA